MLLYTGALTVNGSSHGREHAEKISNTFNTDLWSGIDGLNYWGRPHRLTVFMSVGVGNVTPLGGHSYAGIFMQPPGLPPWNPNPNFPYAILRYAADSLSDPSLNERWELITAKGDGSAQVIHQLSGVAGPKSAQSVGGAKTQRLEIVYSPGNYVAALIDGKEGARESVTIPIPGTVPGANVSLAGVGVYVDTGNINDAARAEFSSLMLEGYRP